MPLGGIKKNGERYTYTNSLEAMKLSYKKGYKMFEVDLSLTKDNHIVASHTPVSDKTLADFLNTRIKNNILTPLSLENILKFY